MSNTRRLMFISFVALLAFLFLANQDFSQGATSLAVEEGIAATQANVASPDQGSLIVNGSFESGCVNPAPSFVQLNGGDTCLPGWVVLPVNIHYVAGAYWEASDGSRSLDLDGATGAAGGIQQTFPTIPGTRYTVRFDLAGNPESGPTIKSMRVSADGQSAVFNFDITGKTVRNMGWRRETWNFTADDSSATLQFISLNGSGWGPSLDNVNVLAIEVSRVTEFKVNIGSSEVNQSPSTTILADGRFVVGWHQGGPTDCFGRVFSREGLPVGGQFLLNPFTSSAWKYGPALAPLPDGGFATFWGHSSGARGQRFDNRFNPAGGDFLFEPIGEPWPVITALANKDIVVIGDHQSAPYPIIAKRYNPSLVPYGPATQVNTALPGIRLFTSAIAAAPNGTYTVAWYNSSGDIIARSFDSSGNVLGNEFRVNSSIGGSRFRPSPAYNSRNELIIAWDGSGVEDSDGIYIRRFSSSGSSIGDEQRVNQIVTGARSSANLAIGSKDEIVISWTAPDSSGAGVFARMYRFDAVPITGEFQVNQATSGNQWAPFFGGRRGNLVVDDRLVFTWAGSGAEGDGVYMTIFPVSDVPQIATVSAASFKQPPGARESIVASFGTNLATDTVSAPTLPLPTTLAGTTVKITDIAGIGRLALLFFVSPTQVNYQVPPETANGLATVTITSGNGTVSYGVAQIETVAPGLFAANADGQGVPAGYALRVKPGGLQINEPISRYDAVQKKYVPVPIDLSPATDQLFLILFGTGIRFRTSLSAVTATIGGTSVGVHYAGPQGDFVGLDQVNLRLLSTLAGRGEVDVILTVDGKMANTVRVNIK